METILTALGLKEESQITRAHLLELYWQVSRCMENYALAVLHNMTVEKALNILREVRDHAWTLKQWNLSHDAHKLLWHIVDNQETPSEVELASYTHLGVDLEFAVDQVAPLAVVK